MGSATLETLPFDLQIKILSHLLPNDVKQLQILCPTSWKDSCNSIIVWRDLIERNLSETPILDSNYAFKIIDLLASNTNPETKRKIKNKIQKNETACESIGPNSVSSVPLFKEQDQLIRTSSSELTSQDKQEIYSKLELLDISIFNHQQQLHKWKNNFKNQENNFLGLASYGLGYFKNALKKLSATPEILMWGQGLENDRCQQSANFYDRLMWERPEVMNVRATEHGGITFKYLKGMYRNDFILRACYTATKRERQRGFTENRRGQFDSETDNFEISRALIGKVQNSHHFCMCLSTRFNYEKDPKLKKYLQEYSTELEAFILQNIRHRIQQQRLIGLNNSVTEVKLGIILFKDTEERVPVENEIIYPDYNIYNIVKNFDLIGLENKVRLLCQENESNQILTSGNYSTRNNSRFVLH